MPPSLTGSFSNHLAPGIFKILGTRLGGRESSYSRILNTVTSTRNYEDFLYATGLPIAVEKPQATDIQSYDPIEGSTKRVTPKVYAIGFEVSQEAWEDDLYAGQGSALRDAAEGLADSLAERVEVEAHRPFNEGFTTTVNNGWPGITDVAGTDTLFDTSHPILPGAMGAAQGNRPSTDTDLTISAYRTALTGFRTLTNDQGLHIPAYTFPSQLIVAPASEYDAREIVNSQNRPDTANRVENVTRGATSVNVDPYVTDTDSWYLQAPKHNLYFVWRWRPRYDNFDDRKARVAINVAYERFGVIAAHWLGNYGCPGA